MRLSHLCGVFKEHPKNKSCLLTPTLNMLHDEKKMPKKVVESPSLEFFEDEAQKTLNKVELAESFWTKWTLRSPPIPWFCSQLADLKTSPHFSLAFWRAHSPNQVSFTVKECLLNILRQKNLSLDFQFVKEQRHHSLYCCHSTHITKKPILKTTWQRIHLT